MWSNACEGCGRREPAIRICPCPSFSSPSVTRLWTGAAVSGLDETDVPAIRPPAFSKALRLMSNWRAFESSPPPSFWIAKPSGVGSKVCRRLPEPKRAPSWAMFLVSGSGSSSSSSVSSPGPVSKAVWPA